MSSPSPRTLLDRLGLRPRKSLGQHFLTQPHQSSRIVAALELQPEDAVVEVGAGLGALTGLLAVKAGRLWALEVDPGLAAYLTEEFRQQPTVTVLRQDVLTFDFAALARRLGRSLKVVGNLPYQITSPLLFKLAAEKAAVQSAVLMMQQEVAVRLTAAPGGKDYGILSVILQYHFAPERLFSLGPGNFYPPPQVDSAVVRLKPRRPEPAARDYPLFERVVKAAFGRRRKTLKNSLTPLAQDCGLTPEGLVQVLTELGLNPGRRPETLSGADFVFLSNRLADLTGDRAAGLVHRAEG